MSIAAMGKAKSKSLTVGSIQQKHLHSRISYLYQAATYLAHVRQKRLDSHLHCAVEVRGGHNPPQERVMGLNQEQQCQTSSNTSQDEKDNTEPVIPLEPRNKVVAELSLTAGSVNQGMSPRLLSHLREVSLKGQIRLSPAIKHSVCKGCAALLITGSTSTRQVENKSRNGRKPWADILVISCNACGRHKRFPLGARRQARKSDRKPLSAQTLQQTVPKDAGESSVRHNG